MKIKREYSIAAVVLGGIVLLIFGMNFLKGLDLLQKSNVYHVVYRDVSGVTSASPVFFNGLKVGQVIGTEMLPDGSGLIAISFQLNERKREFSERQIHLAWDVLAAKGWLSDPAPVA